MPAEWVKRGNRVGKEVRWERRELGTPSEKRDKGGLQKKEVRVTAE